MVLFYHLALLSFRRQITYRTATLAGLATNFFFGLLRASVLIALYDGRSQVEGISMNGAVTYTGISQALIAALSLFGWYDVIYSISSGEIAADLLKPMDYFRYWLARDAGRWASQLLLRSVPIMIGYGLLFDIVLPKSISHWFWLLVSVMLAGMVSFAWRFLVNLAGFWSPNAIGIGRFAFAVSWFLSGFLMPLRFFPPWFQSITAFTPFPQMINSVVEVYLGGLTPVETTQVLLVQAAWFIALALAGQIVLRVGVRQLVVQGG